MIEEFKITKITGDKKETVNDFIIEEVPLTINVDDKELVTILCCPDDLDGIIIGFLFTSGLIEKDADIESIVIDQGRWMAYVELVNKDITKDLLFKRLYTSGCGRGTLFYSATDIMHRFKNTSDFRIKREIINSLMIDFQKKSEIFKKTGGVHSAALADAKGIIIFKEDIGRHNAIDKVIGARLKEGGDFKNLIMITSGRISSEVLLKAQKCKIPIVVSKSAPTNQGIRLARDMGITLIGFARGSRMNIYSNEERVIYDV